jgi:hypothetical protein
MTDDVTATVAALQAEGIKIAVDGDHFPHRASFVIRSSG